jgi:hypothetical protein
MKNFKKTQTLLLASFLLVANFFLVGNVFAQDNQLTTEAASSVGVTYQTHIQNQGWTGWVSDGIMSGTEGQSLQMPGLNTMSMSKIRATKPFEKMANWQAPKVRACVWKQSPLI